MSTKDTPKPVAWMMVNTAHPRLTPSVTLTPQTGWHITWEAHPLFDQATVDAAVAAERERIALAWDGCRHEGMPCDMDIGASIRAGELVRWVGGA